MFVKLDRWGKQYIKHNIFVVVFVLFLVLLSPVSAEDEITGSFGVTVRPEVISVMLYEKGTDIVPVSLTPQQTYDVKVTVVDADGLCNLDNLKIKLFADIATTDGSRYTEADFDDALVDPRTCSQAVWLKDSNDVEFMNGEISSWSFQTLDSRIPASENLYCLTDPNSYEFIFPVTIGKVALETTDSNAYLWHVGVKITDEEGLSDYDAFDLTSASRPMNWYGEIQVPENHTVDWGDVPEGTDFADSIARITLGDTISFIANGAYRRTIKAERTWYTAGHESFAILQEDPNLPDTFAIRAYLESVDNPMVLPVLLDDGADTENVPQPVYLGGSVLEGTLDSGDLYDQLTLWIKLAPVMTANKLYSGIITYGIVNDD